MTKHVHLIAVPVHAGSMALALRKAHRSYSRWLHLRLRRTRRAIQPECVPASRAITAAGSLAKCGSTLAEIGVQPPLLGDLASRSQAAELTLSITDVDARGLAQNAFAAGSVEDSRTAGETGILYVYTDCTT